LCFIKYFLLISKDLMGIGDLGLGPIPNKIKINNLIIKKYKK
jgi:hypothetical protein